MPTIPSVNQNKTALNECPDGNCYRPPIPKPSLDPSVTMTRHLMQPCVNSSGEICLPPPKTPAPPSYTPGPLSFHGGPVVSGPQVYLHFWGWQSDPIGARQYITSFVSGLGGNPWLNTVTQYGNTTVPCSSQLNCFVQTPPIINPSQLLGGSIGDAAVFGQGYPASVVGAEAIADEQRTGNSGGIYVIASGPGQSGQGFGTVYCGYHGYAADTSGHSAFYIYLPYIPDAGPACAFQANTLGISASYWGTKSQRPLQIPDRR